MCTRHQLVDCGSARSRTSAAARAATKSVFQDPDPKDRTTRNGRETARETHRDAHASTHHELILPHKPTTGSLTKECEVVPALRHPPPTAKHARCDRRIARVTSCSAVRPHMQRASAVASDGSSTAITGEIHSRFQRWDSATKGMINASKRKVLLHQGEFQAIPRPYSATRRSPYSVTRRIPQIHTQED